MKRILKYIRYNIDLIFSKGILYQLMVLIFIIITTLLFVAIFMKIAFQYPIVDGFWDSLMQFIDTGNISAAEESNGFNAIVATFLAVTFIGVCGWGLLIAMINNALQERIKNLSNGNSFIMERNHSIVLGYGEEVFTIIEEFIMGRSKKIVLLSNYEASYIKKRISFFKKYKNTKVVIRKGNPSRFENLQLLNIERANSVSIVNEDDSESLKILLSLKRILQKENKNTLNKKRHRILNICMLVNKKENIEIVKSIDDSELFNIHIIYKYEILYKLIGQSIMYTGLSNIYEELFDYKGIDIEIDTKHHCNALNLKNAASKYFKDNKILLGIINQEDKTLIIPNNDEKIKTSDKLAVLFRRDDEKKEINITNHIKNNNDIIKHKILLILEENKEKEVMEEIVEYIEKDNIIILHYEKIEKQDIKKYFLTSEIKNNNITKIVLISENIDTDTKAMNILLVIRAIIKDYKYDIPILSLINSIENRDLIYSDDIKDFIVSGKLIGTLMATASKDSDLLYVFGDLLTKGGNDIIMIAYNKLYTDKEKRFIDIYYNLINEGKIAIGIKKLSTIILNPNQESLIDDSCEIIVIFKNAK
ncbi:CASTOR/POLLUX-related putative ion channel [Brachyspira pilosicoli]|uniref:CASTOR/POLLUX-related putative ion channel n=1 Tax=Brachyspira pilosicoli TaxID=52584 RepID=UPI00300404BD